MRSMTIACCCRLENTHERLPAVGITPCSAWKRYYFIIIIIVLIALIRIMIISIICIMIIMMMTMMMTTIIYYDCCCCCAAGKLLVEGKQALQRDVRKASRGASSWRMQHVWITPKITTILFNNHEEDTLGAILSPHQHLHFPSLLSI